MLRLMIVAGIRFYREGLAQALGSRPGFDVVQACDGREALAIVSDRQLDTILLDMATPESLGIVRILHERARHVRIVALGVSEVEEDVMACAEAGVAGYVSREGSLADLLDAISRAACGELVCSPRIAGSLLRRVAALSADHEPRAAVARLTVRERQILRLLEQDLSNKEIAQQLGIEVATVKNHVHNLLDKLNVHGRREAVRRGGRCPERPSSLA